MIYTGEKRLMMTCQSITFCLKITSTFCVQLSANHFPSVSIDNIYVIMSAVCSFLLTKSKTAVGKLMTDWIMKDACF